MSRRSPIARLTSASKLLLHDPRAFFRKIRRRSYLLLQPPLTPLRVASVGGVRMELDLRDPNERSMYAEVYETQEVALMRRVLHPGHTVIDVGANVGYLTSVAADCVGPTGQVHALEPVPQLHRRLERLAALNAGYRIRPLDFAAGDAETVLPIRLSNDGNIGWNTLVPGFMPNDQTRGEIAVRIRPLDDYIDEAGLTDVSFIKIDAEGFEYPVLQGLRRCLRRHRPIVLCEVAPTAYPRLGIALEDLDALLDDLGYRASDLEFRPMEIRGLENTTNVLFLPDEHDPG